MLFSLLLAHSFKLKSFSASFSSSVLCQAAVFFSLIIHYYYHWLQYETFITSVFFCFVLFCFVLLVYSNQPKYPEDLTCDHPLAAH